MLSTISSYLDSHKLLRLGILSVGLVAASLSLFMGFGIYLFVFRPRGDNLLIAVLTLIAILLSCAMGWIIHRRPGPSILAAMMLSFGLTVVGAILISVLDWREHWLELVKELIGLK